MTRSLMTLGVVCLTAAACLAGDSGENPNRESLVKAYPGIPEWFQDAKLGIYTHWGIPAYASRFSDRTGGWYGRWMYRKGHYFFDYHRKHFGDQKTFGYKDLILEWNPEKFDAEEWAELFAESGAKYAGPVAIHHDNYFMWDSKFHRWDTMDTGPKRDFSAELSESIRRRGMKFMGSFHHAQAAKHFDDAHKYDGADPETWDLYTPKGLYSRGSDKDRAYGEFWEKAVVEFVDLYRPDLVYFEGSQGNMAGGQFLWNAVDHYYRSAASRGQEVTVTYKHSGARYLRGAGVLDHERGRESFICADAWQTDTCPGSWFWYGGYDRDDGIAGNDEMIDMFIDIVSKNGNMLLNIPPTGEGEIPEKGKSLLRDMGAWLRVNGEAIYATRAWKVFGEGLHGSRFESMNTGDEVVNTDRLRDSVYDHRDIRYTRSKDGKTLYAVILGWPGSGPLTLKAPRMGGEGGVELLGHGKIESEVGQEGHLTVSIPELTEEERPCRYAYCLKMHGFDISLQPDAPFQVKELVDVRTAGQAVLTGEKMHVGRGHGGMECVKGWHHHWAKIHWLMRRRVPGRYLLRVRVDNRDGRNELIVRVNGRELLKKIPHTKGRPEFFDLGEIDLTDAGEAVQLSLGLIEKPDLGRRAIDVYDIQLAPTIELMTKPSVFGQAVSAD